MFESFEVGVGIENSINSSGIRNEIFREQTDSENVLSVTVGDREC